MVPGWHDSRSTGQRAVLERPLHSRSRSDSLQGDYSVPRPTPSQICACGDQWSIARSPRVHSTPNSGAGPIAFEARLWHHLLSNLL
jgi:hypothetical protein